MTLFRSASSRWPSCSPSPPPARRTPAREPRAGPIFYVMRHLHTPAGERDPDLTAEGSSRRSCSPTGSRRSRRRPSMSATTGARRQTAAPLAARLGLTPIVYDPADTPGPGRPGPGRAEAGPDRRPQQHRARHRRAARRHAAGDRWPMRISAISGGSARMARRCGAGLGEKLSTPTPLPPCGAISAEVGGPRQSGKPGR